MKIIARLETEIKCDLYVRGMWWKSTGFECLFDDNVWWNEYTNNEGEISYFN